MPFTPFHIGPALGAGLPLKNKIHWPTFFVANLVVDIEPFLVLLLGLEYPLHGYLHTFLFASLLGLMLGCLMFVLNRFLNPIYKSFLLESKNKLGIGSFVAAGIFGTMLHVFLDSPLYTDIRPLFPFTENPLYNPALSSMVYEFCLLAGAIGVIYYLGMFVFTNHKKHKYK